MSNNDISRFLFQPAKHYAGMRMQQGRVLLDSDYNEGTAHHDEDERKTLLDLIGQQGSPDKGFLIGTADSSGNFLPLRVSDQVTTTQVTFGADSTVTAVPRYFVQAGSMYVGGLRVQLEQPEFIAFQRDFLQATAADMPGETTPGSSEAGGDFIHFFFLHVWEQCVSAVEDKEILEHALGGPDTSTRVRRMRRVEFSFGAVGDNCPGALERTVETRTADLDPITGELVSKCKLSLKFKSGASEDTCAPCSPDATGRYLGAENQAIRIMLADPASFVWAIDDGAPLYDAELTGIAIGAPSVEVKLLALPKDEEHWPLAGRVVEILPWSAVLPNGEKVAAEVGVFCVVSESYDPATSTFKINTPVTIATALESLVYTWDSAHPDTQSVPPAVEPPLPDIATDPRKFYVRFWHQSDSATEPTIPTQIENPLPLGNTGLIPTFFGFGTRGDYWVAAVRPETPTVILPRELQSEDGAPPLGPRHFYAPLAIISGQLTGDVFAISTVEDCRRFINPVTDMGCCTVTVGDGIHSVGQFSRIQDAIDALPTEGGRVCVRPGLYAEEISVRSNVIIEGCGDRTIVTLPLSPVNSVVFDLGPNSSISLRSMRIQTSGHAVNAFFGADLSFSDLHIVDTTTGETNLPSALMTFSEISSLTIRSVQFELQLSRGLDCVSCTGAFEAITIDGSASVAVREPLISLTGTAFTLTSSTLIASGRVALDIALGGRNPLPSSGTVDNVKFMCRDGAAAGVTSRSAIRAYDAVDLTIRNCMLTMEGGLGEYAAVELDGSNVVFSDNWIKAGLLDPTSPAPWGGVHVRKGIGIEVRGNHITGGQGHGITLGSVEWVPDSPSFPLRFNEPTGKGLLETNTGLILGTLQFTDSDGTFEGVPDGTLEDLLIADNTIEQVRGNGISVLSVLGVPTGAPFLVCKGLRIERNRIHHCLNGSLFLSMPTNNSVIPIGGSFEGSLAGRELRIPHLPFAGIVLATLEGGAWIRDNVVTNNGGIVTATINSVEEDFLPPYSGIFVLFGESLVISGNHVSANGVRHDETQETLKAGFRAGIGVVYATAGIPAETPISDLNSAFPHADELPNPSSPSELLVPDAFGENVTAFALRIIGNTVSHPEGRALFTVGAGAMTIEGNFLASGGNNTAQVVSPPDTLALGDAVYVHNLGKPWEALDPLGAFEPVFESPLNALITAPDAASQYYQAGNIGTEGTTFGRPLFTGFGGQLLFNGNHVVYDWVWQEPRFGISTSHVSYFATAVVSLDHVEMHNNQFAFRLEFFQAASGNPIPLLPFSGFTRNPSAEPQAEALASNVFVLGATVNVSGNRASEGAEVGKGQNAAESTYVSMITYGLLMNTTVFNQGTRCILVYQNDDLTSPNAGNYAINTGNLSILAPTVGCDQVQQDMLPFVGELVSLIIDQRTS